MNSNNNANNGSSLGRSVVPDLMRVYESLTQSSTPQESHAQSHHSQTLQPQSYPQDSGNYLKHTSTPSPNPQFIPADSYVANARHNDAPVASSQHQYYQASRIPTAPHEAHSIQHSKPPLDKVEGSDAQHFDSKITPNLSKKGSSSPPISDQQKLPSTDRENNTGSSSSLSATTKSRKKSGGSDGRWSKRFTWPDELHRDFVAAIFEVGLKHSSPSTILEHMKKHSDVTPERVKSHLQKYRLHRQKSKTEFMSNYDSTLGKIKSGEMDSYDIGSMNCAEVAAHLSHSTSNEHSASANTKEQLYADPNIKLSVGGSKDSVLQLPQLTDEEKKSPLGASMGYLMGLFFALRQQLMNQRATSNVANSATTSASHSYYVQSTVPPPPLPLSSTLVPPYQSSTPPNQHSNNPIINISYEAPPEPPAPNPQPNNTNNSGEYSPKKITLYQAHPAHHSATSNKPSHANQGRSVVHHYARWEVTETPYTEPVPTSDCPPSHYVQNQIENPPHPKLSPRLSPQEVVAESHGPCPAPAQNITKQTHPQIVEFKTKENIPISPRNESQSDFVPEIRDKIEESNQMKREMQSQKEFQNKLRALKQKEISKCSSSYGGIDWKNHSVAEAINPNDFHTANYTEQSKEHRTAPGNDDQQPPTKRSRSESLGGVDDYWSSDMMDDHLFQFLTNTDGD